MTRVPDELANAVVKDLDGRPVRIGDLWKQRPALLLFVRHFG
jgi:hypothetical protein